METKHRFYLIVLLSLILILSIFIFLQKLEKKYYKETQVVINNSIPAEPQIECKTNDRAECFSLHGYKGFRVCENGTFSQCYVGTADECFLSQNNLSTICCKNKDGKVYDCNGRTDFKSNEYVITKVNLQTALQQSKVGFSEYVACGFSELIPVEIYTPERYNSFTKFIRKDVICSSILNAKDFRSGTFIGLIPDVDHTIKLIEWRAYPATANILTQDDAIEKLNLSILIYTIEVNVIE